MGLTPHSEIRDVYGLTDEQRACIHSFLQGAVYCWCKNRPNEWFSLRVLMGGDNYDWDGTPLIDLYEKYRGANDAVERAGKDGGWLLKRVISDDPRIFETRKAEMIRQYRWIQ
jgi:hypothetical protein